MVLTLPFELAAKVSATPVAVLMINGKMVPGFEVTDPQHLEIPVSSLAHCPACGCKASGEIRSCIKPTCPARERKAA
jgi:hypothetical protein